MLIDEEELAAFVHPIFAPVIRFAVHVSLNIVYYVYWAINLTRKRGVVPRIQIDDPTQALLMLPAVDLAKKIWSKETAATKVIEAYIQRAELVNKQINAIVQRNYEFARERAQQIDDQLAKLNTNSQEYKELLVKQPLLGVPLSVKDHIGLKGVKLTIGLPFFANNPPSEENAEVIKRLLSAGAIPFVYSNVPEGVMWIESENTLYGRTSNAYDTRKGVGGSSGGEGALISSGASVIGIGSDIGGSIRIPAMFNGIFGLKPTPHKITFKGCVPDAFIGYQADMACLGPMCRFAKDLKPMLKVLSDPEAVDSMNLDAPVDLNSLRIFYMEKSRWIGSSPLRSDVAGAFYKAVNHFQETRRQSTICVDLPLAKYAVDMWLVGLCDTGALPIPNFFTGFNPEKGLDGWSELPKYLSGNSVHILPVILQCITYDFFAKFNYDTEKRIKLRETLRQQFLDLLGDNGILIYPTLPQSGYYHTEPLWSWTHAHATVLWNCMAFPVVTVPMGLNSDGYPTAVQVVATPGNERLIIRVAEELSDAFGGWQMPQGPVQKS